MTQTTQTTDTLVRRMHMADMAQRLDGARHYHAFVSRTSIVHMLGALTTAQRVASRVGYCEPLAVGTAVRACEHALCQSGEKAFQPAANEAVKAYERAVGAYQKQAD